MVLRTAANTDKLRDAVTAEKLDSTLRLARYKQLTAKISDHQIGKGPAPTEEEFNQWLADVKHAVDLKTMIGCG